MTCRCDTETYARGVCRPCYERDLRKRNPEYAERQRVNSHRWRLTPENLERKRAKDRERYKGRPKTSRAHYTYGLTAEEYRQRMAQPCGICGAPSKHMDHDHRTGRVRGGLCHRCNLGLGYLEGWFVENAPAVLTWLQGSESPSIREILEIVNQEEETSVQQ
ncbi:endonuclease VII [Gordonia phage OneUp]|uniref:EndoVII n=1 Tax=Gordonia phage OneUp TaxID=1838074 RepID=A0A160DF18_9CAUD|nr:endonuclease VII [Gordonia phage OneUp]ANA86462.1 EndoVII [Gordonia phage OneUp]